jgi:putative transposase
MDEPHLPAAARYKELNPVRAGLVTDPTSYPGSSAKAHVEKRDNSLVKVSPLLALVSGWKGFLNEALPEEAYEEIRKPERTGRPLGSDQLIDKLEALLGMGLRKKKTGPKGLRKKRATR